MKLAVISFTGSGRALAEKLESQLSHEVELYDKSSFGGELRSNMSKLFVDYDGIVFVSAVGIAVRYIAPHVKDKTEDPAVVVLDDLGRYSISLLSGHIGGGNDLAGEVGESIGAEVVVTTASDGRGIDSIDEFAKRYDLHIESMEDAKTLTALMVENRPISLRASSLYKLKYGNISEKDHEGVICVDYKTDAEFDLPHCILRPKVIYLGIGCRRGKSFEELQRYIEDTLSEQRISMHSVAAIGSIDIKCDEKGLLKLAEALECEYRLFSKAELNSVETEQNEFVMSKVGANSVAEASAAIMGDEIIMKKKVRDGMTLAISRRIENG